MTAAIYIRVSSGPQAEGASLEAQEAQCRQLIRQSGWRCGKVYADVQTGRTPHRPELTKLRKRLGRYGALVVWRVDRFMRSILDLHQIILECQKAKCRFVSATEHIDVDTSVGKFTLALLGACAEWESNTIGERVRASIQYRLSEGKWPRKPAYGYWRKKQKGAPVEIHEEEAAVVRRIFTERAAGRTQQAIADDLRHDGLTRRGQPWKREQVAQILDNPRYIGEPWVGTNEREGAVLKRVPRSQWQRAEGLVPAIVDRALWDAARAQGMRGRKPSKPALFRGLVVCGGCSLSMYVQSRPHLGYHCLKSRGGCGGPLVRDVVLRELLGTELTALSCNGSMVQAEARDKGELEEMVVLARERYDRAKEFCLEGLLEEDELRSERRQLDQAEQLLVARGIREATPEELAVGVKECGRALRLAEKGQVDEGNLALRSTVARIVVRADREGVDVVLWGDCW